MFFIDERDYDAINRVNRLRRKKKEERGKKKEERRRINHKISEEK